MNPRASPRSAISTTRDCEMEVCGAASHSPFCEPLLGCCPIVVGSGILSWTWSATKQHHDSGLADRQHQRSQPALSMNHWADPSHLASQLCIHGWRSLERLRFLTVTRSSCDKRRRLRVCKTDPAGAFGSSSGSYRLPGGRVGAVQRSISTSIASTLGGTL